MLTIENNVALLPLKITQNIVEPMCGIRNENDLIRICADQSRSLSSTRARPSTISSKMRIQERMKCTYLA